jgi:hypothetical protein
MQATVLLTPFEVVKVIIICCICTRFLGAHVGCLVQVRQQMEEAVQPSKRKYKGQLNAFRSIIADEGYSVFEMNTLVSLQTDVMTDSHFSHV